MAVDVLGNRAFEQIVHLLDVPFAGVAIAAEDARGEARQVGIVFESGAGLETFRGGVDEFLFGVGQFRVTRLTRGRGRLTRGCWGLGAGGWGFLAAPRARLGGRLVIGDAAQLVDESLGVDAFLNGVLAERGERGLRVGDVLVAVADALPGLPFVAAFVAELAIRLARVHERIGDLVERIDGDLHATAGMSPLVGAFGGMPGAAAGSTCAATF